MNDSVNRDFGADDADMSVHDKNHPTLGPTEGSQDVDSLPRNVVPMAAFNDPNNPVAVSGSVNLSLDDHPVTHDPDYGKTYAEVYGLDSVQHTMSEGAKALGEFDQSQDGVGGSTEERDGWSKAQWQKAAKKYSLPTSGNIATLREKVEAYEADASLTDEERAAQEREEQVEAAKGLNAGDWQSHVAAAESADDLAELQALYKESGASYATVEKAFADRETEFKSTDES